MAAARSAFRFSSPLPTPLVDGQEQREPGNEVDFLIPSVFLSRHPRRAKRKPPLPFFAKFFLSLGNSQFNALKNKEEGRVSVESKTQFPFFFGKFTSKMVQQCYSSVYVLTTFSLEGVIIP